MRDQRAERKPISGFNDALEGESKRVTWRSGGEAFSEAFMIDKTCVTPNYDKGDGTDVLEGVISISIETFGR